MEDQSLYNIEVETLGGQKKKMDDYRDDVLLIVNTASKCGFTPQYEGLEKLYNEYKERGFKVLGFPCNQFGQQEPGGSSDIESFCQINYGVSFPMFSKVDVNGDNAHPLFRFLKKEKKGMLATEAIKWNFTKFLVNRKGEVLKRYAPNTEPAALGPDVEKALNS